MNKITVSINPSYFCNFRCNFCYLTSQQLGDQKQIPLVILDKKLKELGPDLLDETTTVELFKSQIRKKVRNSRICRTTFFLDLQ